MIWHRFQCFKKVLTIEKLLGLVLIAFISNVRSRVSTSSSDADPVVYVDLIQDDKTSLCDRDCSKANSMKCVFTFHIELYNSLGRACFDCPMNKTDCERDHCIPADLVERGLIVVNRRMPGTPIVVCQGDNVVVNVINNLQTETTSIHWHGLHQKGYQFMDGIPYITQCPIGPLSRFRYEFLASTPGTHFYHSHSSYQRADGLFGALIVREQHDPHAWLYDEDLSDHVIFAQEWFHKSSREAFVLHHWDTGPNKADNILINGKGQFGYAQPISNDVTPAIFKVESGRRYRFRVISPGFTLCPIIVSVDEHNLLMIASDGVPFRPQNFKSFVISPGERYDFVLDAFHENGTFPMRFGGLFDCSSKGAHALAFLHYVNSKIQIPSDTKPTKYSKFVDIAGSRLNALNYAPIVKKEGSLKKSVMSLKHLKDLDSNKDRVLQENPDKKFYLAFDLLVRYNPYFHHSLLYSFDQVGGANKLRTPQINNITLKLPASPLLSQLNVVDSKDFCHLEDQEKCTARSSECANGKFCECIHVLEVNLNDVVEIFLIDEGFAFDVSHPFHLHGYSFRVVAMERHGINNSHVGASKLEGNSIRREDVIKLDVAGKIKRNLVNAPLKDTVTIPDGGFTVIRFLADNPGFWLLHCHMSWHNSLGMAVIIKVGDIEKDVGPAPKGFPTCGNF